MKIMKDDVYNFSSLGEIILQKERSRLKRWLLKRLIPMELWTSPTLWLAKVNKGDAIGRLEMTICENISNGGTIDLGLARDDTNTDTDKP